MRRGSFGSLLVFLVAIAGVAFAVYTFLKRNRDEEYWDEFDDYDYDDDDGYAVIGDDIDVDGSEEEDHPVDEIDPIETEE